jgi:leucyl-tRNA synthetase
MIETEGFGKKRINYRLRDAVFGRQRYWGEPIPVYYKEGVPYVLDESELPLTLPEVDKYLPTEDGEPPLARANNWKYKGEFDYEHSTMPGWAGSSWYFLRYMDPHNEGNFADPAKIAYWKQVDLYIGGSEHATGHLLYSRFWTKVLFDLGLISFDEPFQKMINQGMILGKSAIAFIGSDNKLYSYDSLNKDALESYREVRILIDLIRDDESIIIEELRKWQPQYEHIELVPNDKGQINVKREVDKMSKRWFNVVNPDDLCEKFGADTLRMYEMFLGPLEQFKPWDTKGINGVHNFLRKLWRLFYENGNRIVTDNEPSKDSLKTLHKTIKKIEEDLERFSFNTGVSQFMICVNELTDQKCHEKAVLEQLLILLSPYAPHIAEELWEAIGHEAGSLSFAQFPVFNPELLVEANFSYPVSFNGKMRFTVELPADMSAADVQNTVMAMPEAEKWLEGKTPKKVIVVPGRIVNIVI